MDFIGSVPVVGIGHNGGPPLDEAPRPSDWNHYCWKRAHKRAWKNPGREVMLLRLRRAEECGMTYKEYTAVILDRGVYLQKDDVLPKPREDKDR
jgi:hypothetical protein